MHADVTSRTIEEAEVALQQTLGPDYRLMTLVSPNIARRARPGQFVHLRLPGLDPAYLLRRPFSLHRAVGDRITILYKQVGVGTAAMARLRSGDRVSVMGPLGNGFPPLPDGFHPLLIGGGYGSAPLFFLAERTSQKGVVFLGGKGRTDLLGDSDFKALGWDVHMATEDGSAGCKGLVTAMLEKWLAEHSSLPTVWYACGPDGMLRAVALLAVEHGVQAWLSLDRRMGCGAGVCLACVVKIQDPEKAGSWKWARVCRDGPVFESRQILWEGEFA